MLFLMFRDLFLSGWGKRERFKKLGRLVLGLFLQLLVAIDSDRL